MPFVIVHNALAGQRQSKPWVFLPAILRRMLTSLEDNNSRSPVERRATASNSRDDVVMDAGEQSGSGAESGWSEVSDNSSTDSECTILEASSVASDQDRFDTQPMAFRVDLSAGLYDIDTTKY